MGTMSDPIPENPAVVKGGPLDPTSPEAQGPEGKIVGGPGSPIEASGQPITPPMTQEPIYRGFVDVKDVEDLKTYTKNLEQKLTEAQAARNATSPSNPINPPAPIPRGTDPAIQKFTETVYSNPEAAAQALLDEASRRAQASFDQRISEEESRKSFWKDFYDRNPDLHKMQDLVQSVHRAHDQEVRTLKTAKDVEEFLSKETRKMVNLVKNQTGYTETTVPSQGAVTLGSTRTPAPTAPVAPAQAQNLSEQIRSIRPKPIKFVRK